MAGVLVAEDDKSLLDFLTMVLRQAGHDVHTASNGVEALMKYSSYRSSIDVVVTDVVMPGINGVELAVRLCALNPALPILLMTGFVPDDIALPCDLQVLLKPFQPGRLLDAIQLAVAAPPAKGSR